MRLRFAVETTVEPIRVEVLTTGFWANRTTVTPKFKIKTLLKIVETVDKQSIPLKFIEITILFHF